MPDSRTRSCRVSSRNSHLSNLLNFFCIIHYLATLACHLFSETLVPILCLVQYKILEKLKHRSQEIFGTFITKYYLVVRTKVFGVLVRLQKVRPPKLSGNKRLVGSVSLGSVADRRIFKTILSDVADSNQTNGSNFNL